MEPADWAVDPVAAVSARLADIAARNPGLNAFLTVEADCARQAAREAAARRAGGKPLSPLDGMPMAIKANIAVAGWACHAGIAAYRTRVAPHDAACVARLRAGGAIVLGLANMDEAALGDGTDNPHFGRTANPLQPGFTAGGSSGGSAAAVAAGFCEAALGTDTLGSVRIPAAYCGIIGHKPPHGILSTQGIMPTAPAFDTVGILARTPATARAVRRWLGSALPPADPERRQPVGLFPLDGVEVRAEIAETLAAAAEKARAAGYLVRTLPKLDDGLREIARAAFLVVAREAASLHFPERAADAAGFSAGLRKMLDWASAQPEARHQAARGLLARVAAELRQSFAAYRAVLMPTTPNLAFPFGNHRPAGTADFTTLANVAGFAATAFPAGVQRNGLPVSIQAVGPDEAACLALAEQLTAGRYGQTSPGSQSGQDERGLA